MKMTRTLFVLPQLAGLYYPCVPIHGVPIVDFQCFVWFSIINLRATVVELHVVHATGSALFAQNPKRYIINPMHMGFDVRSKWKRRRSKIIIDASVRCAKGRDEMHGLTEVLKVRVYYLSASLETVAWPAIGAAGPSVAAAARNNPQPEYLVSPSRILAEFQNARSAERVLIGNKYHLVRSSILCHRETPHADLRRMRGDRRDTN